MLYFGSKPLLALCVKFSSARCNKIILISSSSGYLITPPTESDTHKNPHSHTRTSGACVQQMASFLDTNRGVSLFCFLFLFFCCSRPNPTFYTLDQHGDLISKLWHQAYRCENHKKTTEAVSFTGLREAAMSISASSPQLKTINQTCNECFGHLANTYFFSGEAYFISVPSDTSANTNTHTK